MDTKAKLRKLVLEVLRNNHAIDRAVTFEDLWETMHDLGKHINAEAMRELLSYLAKKGFISITRRNELPGFSVRQMSSKQHDDDILTIRLLPDGLDQVEA